MSFLQEKFLEDEEPLDKTYTPPAPMMSRTQQKIVTLITSLEKLMPNIVDLVTAGIDFSLFRLSTDYKDVCICIFFPKIRFCNFYYKPTSFQLSDFF